MKEKIIIEPPHKTRFYIKSSEYRDESWAKNTWSYTKVEIFDREQGDIKIGEYMRNYPSRSDKTFFPFKRKDGKWFALYSECYHSTYVMSLPDCKKIAECDSGRPDSKFDKSGFCPAEYWVPFVSAWEMEWGKNSPDKPTSEIMWHDPEENGDIDEPYDLIDWHHLDIGFIYGCYWGGEYEICLMDLSRVEDGVLNIEHVFDPYELPRKIKHIKDVIEIECNDVNPEPYAISVLSQRYSLKRDKDNLTVTSQPNFEA